MLTNKFFDQDAQELARALLGKVLRHRVDGRWLSAMITETEAYYRNEKASHSSLGFTPKRRAMFMPPGTIYMYYARGGDSLNISVQGEGNAVLIKAARAWFDKISPPENLAIMQQMNPIGKDRRQRSPDRLCSGQTLLCRSLGLKVNDWDQKNFLADRFYIDDLGIVPERIVQTTRLGIPKGRDEHLPYRFIFLGVPHSLG
ncbi:MAG: 3-methyladenine DNA glycosylase [Bdellovibrionales bacterium GWA2_49_15]|nr:MAG: 3-methyladenine DNA glycosylase [Bdellovibrionales bacterium GWA2_49_15]HAZ13394.1 DNA-3-methyladenine glycosylase [Bdellovibrionales bacterium]